MRGNVVIKRKRDVAPLITKWATVHAALDIVPSDKAYGFVIIPCCLVAYRNIINTKRKLSY